MIVKQREEDRKDASLDIAVPPKYIPKDFLKTSYWSQRGKLDVAKERFISYPGGLMPTTPSCSAGPGGIAWIKRRRSSTS